MHVQDIFEETDQKRIFDLVEQNAFATLITYDNGVPCANHLPLMVEKGDKISLLGHMAKSNSQWQHFNQDNEVLAIFTGPHAYISPSNHQPPGVPTWNYAAVHMYGKCRVVEDDQLKTIIESLSHKYEKNQPSPWIPDYPDRAFQAIVGFEIVVDRIEAKSKLSQNKSESDRQRIISTLGNSNRDEEKGVAALMRENEFKVSS
ncbi:FMN-binding negative transcriptional regulator [Pseudomonadota bacterium]